jgi:hypothetical protein
MVNKVMTTILGLPFIDTMMTTIVFYGFDGKLPIKDAKKLIDSICNLLGEHPSHAHVGLDEEGRKSRGPKFKMLDKAIEKGDFDDYSYVEAVNYFEKGNVRDCSFSVGINNASHGKRLTVHFKSAREKPMHAIALLEEILKFVSPEYGISYDMAVRGGPLWFVTGVRSSGMPDELSRASGEFRQEYFFGKKFKDGYFRDVFDWNYLSQAHLDQLIEGRRFRDWIKEPTKENGGLGKAKSRGTLVFLDNGKAIWELSKDEVVVVRALMLKAGLLMVKN